MAVEASQLELFDFVSSHVVISFLRWEKEKIITDQMGGFERFFYWAIFSPLWLSLV